MTFAGILFLTAFLISAVAEYYAIAGLVAIFASNPIGAIILGCALAAGKLVAASWLYRNWQEAPRLLKYYFTLSVLILSLITSMGIFGYLSKAHLEQSVVIGESADKLLIYDEKIKPKPDENGQIPDMIDMFGGSGGFTTGSNAQVNSLGVNTAASGTAGGPISSDGSATEYVLALVDGKPAPPTGLLKYASTTFTDAETD